MMLHSPTRSLPLFIILISIIAAGCASNKAIENPGDKEIVPPVPSEGLGVITPERMEQHIGCLASDAMMGRATPSPGLDSAAAYIAREFDKIGITPCNNVRFQSLNMNTIELGKDNHLLVVKDNKTVDMPVKTGFIPFEVTAGRRVAGSVVFAGYGITAPEYGYDDYAGIDVKGKIVVALRHEPGENDSTSIFKGTRATSHSSVMEKTRTAREHGAAALVLVTGPANHLVLQPTGYPWPSMARSKLFGSPPTTIGISENDKIPVVHAGQDFIVALFGSVDSLKSIQKRIDAATKPQSFAMPDATIDLKVDTKVTASHVDNVIGYIEGSDPVLKNQAVVIGGHYDHIGYRKSSPVIKDSIFNGADDNASGTSGVLAIAEAFAHSRVKPRRSVLFVLFAGEERGLLGSQVYVANPIIPLKQTVAMLNLDMISRNGIDSLTIVDSLTSPMLYNLIKDENRHVGFTLRTMDDGMFGRSDHANFSAKGIPSMFFFTELHRDYHQVGDNPDRTNPSKAARVAQLVFRTAWRLANMKIPQN
jgi:hypothetical protein